MDNFKYLMEWEINFSYLKLVKQRFIFRCEKSFINKNCYYYILLFFARFLLAVKNLHFTFICNVGISE